jgi:DUF4097 and DUF4098 domain-containing protein YvlB
MNHSIRLATAPAPLLALALLTCASTGAAVADTTVERTFPIDADGEVEIINEQGRIDVRAWPDARVRVVAELEGDPDQLEISHDDAHALVKVEVEKNWYGRRSRDQDAELTIDVPVGVHLQISSVSADVTVRDHAGRQRVQSVSGNIDIDGDSVDAEVESISGDVEYRGNGTQGRFDISAVSGDALVLEVGGDLRVSSISGDARVRGGEITDARLETVSGDVELEGHLVAGARLRAESVSGEVVLALCDRRDIAFDLESFSGNIRDRVTGRRQKDEDFGPGAELRFSEGDGSTRVRVNTMSGRIDIRDCD